MVTLTFDLRPRPLTLNLVTLTLAHVTSNLKAIHPVKCLKITFLAWWPWPLTFTHDLDIINVHHRTKYDHPTSSGSKDIYFYLVIFCPRNYFLVTDGQTDEWKATHKSPSCMSTGGLKNYAEWPEISIFYLVTLTFDLRPFRSTQESSGCMLVPNFMTLATIVVEIWIMSSEFWSSNGQRESDA